jgi:hypothetical protein
MGLDSVIDVYNVHAASKLTNPSSAVQVVVMKESTAYSNAVLLCQTLP